MSFDFHLDIQEDSHRWQAVQKVAQERQVTPQQAAEEVFDAGVRAQVNARKAQSGPNLAVAETLPIFGIFADKPEFSEAIDRVIASRSERYAKLGS